MRTHFSQPIFLTFLQQMMTTRGIMGHYTFSWFPFPRQVFPLLSVPSSSRAETNKDTDRRHILSDYFDSTQNVTLLYLIHLAQ